MTDRDQEREDEEFFEEFGTRLSEQQLDAIVELSRATDNAPLRRLVEQFRFLRMIAGAVVQHADADCGDAIKGNAYWKLLRFLVRPGD